MGGRNERTGQLGGNDMSIVFSDSDEVIRSIMEIKADSVLAQLAIGACMVDIKQQSPYTIVTIQGHEMPLWQQKILEAWVLTSLGNHITEEGI